MGGSPCRAFTSVLADISCGSGSLTVELAPRFEQVVLKDRPSAGQFAQPLPDTEAEAWTNSEVGF